MNTTKASSGILQSTLAEIQRLQKNAENCQVIFDLDSTLFDVTPRLQKILHDFAHDPDNQIQFPENCALLQSAEVQHKDWGIKNALVRAGLDGKHPRFEAAIKKFWQAAFFSNEYLEYDIPYPGAVEFVKAVARTGANVTYLSARDIPRLAVGTEKVLRKWAFPLDSSNCQIVLKPSTDMDDAQFKSDFMGSLKDANAIWLFENEPVNVNLIRKDHPHIKIIFVNSVHAGKQEVLEDLPQILHFIFD